MGNPGGRRLDRLSSCSAKCRETGAGRRGGSAEFAYSADKSILSNGIEVNVRVREHSPCILFDALEINVDDPIISVLFELG